MGIEEQKETGGTKIQLESRLVVWGLRMLSTRNLNEIPAPDVLMRHARALALFSILLGGLEYSFYKEWRKGIMLATFDNGSGDRLSVFSSARATLIKGFAHESAMSPYDPPDFEPEIRHGIKFFPGMLDGLPDELIEWVSTSDDGIEFPTFAIWRITGWASWCIGNIAWPAGEDDPDGSEYLLGGFDGDASAFVKRARAESRVKPPDVAAVAAIFAGETLTTELLAGLRFRPQPPGAVIDAAQLVCDTGYPIDGDGLALLTSRGSGVRSGDDEIEGWQADDEGRPENEGGYASTAPVTLAFAKSFQNVQKTLTGSYVNDPVLGSLAKGLLEFTKVTVRVPLSADLKVGQLRGRIKSVVAESGVQVISEGSCREEGEYVEFWWQIDRPGELERALRAALTEGLIPPDSEVLC